MKTWDCGCGECGLVPGVAGGCSRPRPDDDAGGDGKPELGAIPLSVTVGPLTCTYELPVRLAFPMTVERLVIFDRFSQLFAVEYLRLGDRIVLGCVDSDGRIERHRYSGEAFSLLFPPRFSPTLLLAGERAELIVHGPVPEPRGWVAMGRSAPVESVRYFHAELWGHEATRSELRARRGRR